MFLQKIVFPWTNLKGKLSKRYSRSKCHIPSFFAKRTKFCFHDDKRSWINGPLFFVWIALCFENSRGRSYGFDIYKVIWRTSWISIKTGYCTNSELVGMVLRVCFFKHFILCVHFLQSIKEFYVFSLIVPTLTSTFSMLFEFLIQHNLSRLYVFSWLWF